MSPTVTASYDITAPCYALGEHLGAAADSNGPIAWGDRQLWKKPADAIISGIYAQQDVFFGALP